MVYSHKEILASKENKWDGLTQKPNAKQKLLDTERIHSMLPFYEEQNRQS